MLGEVGILNASAFISFFWHIVSRLQPRGESDGKGSSVNSISLFNLIQGSSRGFKVGGSMEREFNRSINCVGVFKVEVICSGRTSLKAAFLAKNTRIVKAIYILKL